MSFAKLTVESIMTSKVFSIVPTMTVGEAVNLLLQNKISGAPIVNQAGVVISVMTEGDLLKLTATDGLDKKVGACMEKLTKTADLRIIRKSDSCVDAYRMFLKHDVHRLIVCDANGKLQGIVSRSNILRMFAGEKKEESEIKAS